MSVQIPLPGGQDRLRQVILHVARRCAEAPYFGQVKLNKIIWKADFDSFAARGVPVTGRAYKRQRFGPVAAEMMPVYNDMLRDGTIGVVQSRFRDGVVEKRTVAVSDANLDRFSPEDLGQIDRSIAHYWDMTGLESSDDSHGVAWSTRHNGDDMPYELSYLSDARLTAGQAARLSDRLSREGWTSE